MNAVSYCAGKQEGRVFATAWARSNKASMQHQFPHKTILHTLKTMHVYKEQLWQNN